MALATQLTEVEIRLEELLKAKRNEFELKFIERSQSVLIPDYPAVLIQGRNKRRLPGGTRKYNIEFVVDIVVQFELIDAGAISEAKMEPTAEAIDKYITDNRQLLDENGENQLVIHGYVTNIAYGIVPKKDGTRQAARLTYEALSQEMFNG